MDNLRTLLLVGGFTSFLFFIIGIGLYVLFVIGLYGLARTEETGNEWFAFIPILQLYIIGKILKEIKIGGYIVPSLELVLPLELEATPAGDYLRCRVLAEGIEVRVRVDLIHNLPMPVKD